MKCSRFSYSKTSLLKIKENPWENLTKMKYSIKKYEIN